MTWPLVLALLAIPQPQSPPDDSLVAMARARPDDARDAVRRLLFTDSIAEARVVAAAYATAWRDSFWMRRVDRFASLSVAGRRAAGAVDSLRRAGNAALRRAGVDSALALWRASASGAATLGDSAALGAALGSIGAGYYTAGALDSAERYLGQARVIATAVGDHRTAGNAVGTLGSVAMDRGDLGRARALYAEAADIRPRSGDTRGAAADRNNIGLIAEMLGDLDDARQAFEQALTLNQEAGRLDVAATNRINLGNIASITGDYTRAEREYREALAAYRSTGSRPDEASALHHLGLLSLRRGEYRAAQTNLTGALVIYLATGPLTEVIAVRRSLADARAAAGDLQGAVTELRAAEGLASQSDVPLLLRAHLALSRADLAVQLNMFADAERRYVSAADLYRRAGDASGRAQAQQGRGLILLLRGDSAGAGEALRQAILSQEAAQDRRSAALTRLYAGHLALDRGDTAGARQVFQRALGDIQRVGDPVGEAAALAALGDLETAAGLSLTAESLYTRAASRIAGRPAAEVAWQIQAGWAEALERRGALADAAVHLAKAVAEVERVSSRLPVEDRRAAYRADKWEVYASQARVERLLGHDAAAFAASERLRARQMLDVLARGKVTLDTNRAVVGEEQDLRRRIDQLTRRLEANGTDGDERDPSQGAASEGVLREALARAQQRYGDLLVEMREDDPEYAALVSGSVATSRDVAQALAPSEVMVEYLVGDSTTLAFVLRRDTAVTIDLDIGRHELVGLVEFARAALAGGHRDSVPGRSLWRAPFRRLDQKLVQQLEAAGVLRGAERLIVAPHAELHYLPFAALLGSDGRYLVQRYTVLTVPSASVWLRLRERAPAPRDGGVIALAPRPTTLPGSRAEARAIGGLYGARAQVLVGASATRRAFQDLASRQSIIHLATLGVLNRHNPLFSFVQLADDRLEVHDVFNLDLRARLVVLSACQTALGSGALADVPAGDDWVGLVRAFLNAGAENVLATLWPVEDRSTADLMVGFYRGLAAGSAEPEALAAAQRRLLAQARTASPFYWAGFTLVGAGRP